MELVLVVVALAVGGLLAVQASVNQQLNRAVGSPYAASSLQLLVALAALVLVAVAAGQVAGVGRVVDAHPWWLLLGGLASPVYITAGIILFPRVGAVTAVGLFVTGQVLSSVLLDLFGLIGVPRQPLGAVVTVGAAIVVLGITIVVRGQPAAGGGPVAGVRPAWVVLGLVAGAGLPLQGAVNAGLENDVDAPLAVGSISFGVASLAILVVLAVLLATGLAPRPAVRPLAAMPWWGWLGGLCAASYVTATFLLIPELGAAVTVALTVTGQQVASGVIDHLGWLRMPRRPVTAARLTGLGMLVAGSALVQAAG